MWGTGDVSWRGCQWVHRGDTAAVAAALSVAVANSAPGIAASTAPTAAFSAALPGERGMVDGRPCQDLRGTPRMHSRHTRAHTEQKS